MRTRSLTLRLITVVALLGGTDALTACTSSRAPGASASASGTATSTTTGQPTSSPSSEVSSRVTGSAPESTAAAAPARPCSLFTTARLHAAFGVAFGTGTTQQSGPTAGCRWKQPGADPLATYEVDVSATKNATTGFGAERNGPLAKYYESTPSRVGSDSVWFTSPGSPPNEQATLLVLSRGYRWQLDVTRPKGLVIATTRARLLRLATPAFR